MKCFLALYMLASLAVVFLRIDRWPISNFSVFRSPAKIERAGGYRWLIQPADGSPAEYYKFSSSKVHDSLSWSIANLLLHEGGRPDAARDFAEKYISAELRIAGKWRAGTVVRLLRNETVAAAQPIPGARVCWARDEKSYYCVVENDFYKFAL